MELHFSRRESKGLERTKLWVVFQLLGLSLWGKRERVWIETREEGFDMVFGERSNDLKLREERLTMK